MVPKLHPFAGQVRFGERGLLPFKTRPALPEPEGSLPIQEVAAQAIAPAAIPASASAPMGVIGSWSGIFTGCLRRVFWGDAR